MKINKRKGLSIIFTFAVITVLIYSGPASALTIGISDLVASASGTSSINFLAKIDLHTNDFLINSTNLTISMTNSEGETNYSCIFDIYGNSRSTCTGITVALQEMNGAESSGYGYAYAYGYGYDYVAQTTSTKGTNFTSYYGYNHGYAYSAGNGYDTYTTVVGSGAELIYNVTWTTPNVAADADYTIDLKAFVTDGANIIQYETVTNNKGSITIVTAEQGSTDEATVAAVKDELTYPFILLDNSATPPYTTLADLYFPTSLSGVDISWSSNTTATINNSGALTRSAVNVSVLLTASLNKSTASDTKTFTVISKAQVEATVPDDDGVINATGNEVVFNATTVLNVTTVQALAADNNENETVSMNFGELMNVTDKTLTLNTGNNLTLFREGTLVNYTAEIPNGTVVSGDTNWNGIINLPTVLPSDNYNVSSGDVDVVVDVGSGAELNFSKAVKIVIGGAAGKSAAWARGNSTLIKITTTCDSLTAPTNINTLTPRECSINSGVDLVIWTYHFTTFAAYTPSSTSTGGTGGSSSTYSNEYLIIPFDNNEYSLGMKVGSKATFTFKGVQHEIKITQKGLDFVVFTVTSEPQSVKLLVGEYAELDIDGDKTSDLYIRLDRIQSSNAFFTVKSLLPTTTIVLSKTQLIQYAGDWVSGLITKDQLIEFANEWART